MILLRVLAVGVGLALVGWTCVAVVRTFVVPRALPVPMVRLVFLLTRRVFGAVIRLRGAGDYARHDRIMALWAPVTLLLLPGVWLLLCGTGFALIGWGIEGEGVRTAVVVSGSSLLTLGFASTGTLPGALLAFAEAAVGVGLLSVVITYLPSIYSGFHQRELVVAMLDARAGTPPWCVTLIERHHTYAGLDELDRQWAEWERWFAEIGESHATLAMLVFFRSQRPEHSWVTAAGAILDAANLRMSAIAHAGPGSAGAFMTLTGGTGALRRIASFYQVPLDEPALALQRIEFDDALAELAAADVPLVADRGQAWERFARRRAAYEPALLGLASLVDAAPAPWSADRSPPLRMPPIFFQARRS